MVFIIDLEGSNVRSVGFIPGVKKRHADINMHRLQHGFPKCGPRRPGAP